MTIWSRAAGGSHHGGARFFPAFPAVLALVASLLTSPAWSGQCAGVAGGNPPPLPRIDINPNGTATDVQSGLTWMRCALGQRLNGNSCEGPPRAWSWSSAKTELEKLNNSGGFAGFTDWRLPRLPELASIVDPACQDPRIDLSVFPATEPRAYWSSSAKRGESGVIYTLSFGREGVELLGVDEFALVRPVREGH